MTCVDMDWYKYDLCRYGLYKCRYDCISMTCVGMDCISMTCVV